MQQYGDEYKLKTKSVHTLFTAYNKIDQTVETTACSLNIKCNKVNIGYMFNKY